jgi:hypothetical protein
VVVFVASVACQGCSTTRPASDLDRPDLSSGERIEKVLLSGGVVVRRGRPNERLDLLLERHQGFLVLTAAAENMQLEAADTLDIGGLYVHSANHFKATVDTTPSLRAGALSIAMYVAREGPGVGSPAKWLIGPYEIERVEPSENHPAGPADERVGCYSVERGEWSDPEFQWDPSKMPLWFPDTVQLHWQYQWPNGPEPYLVATDASGQIRDERITYFGWSPMPSDSVRVTFGVWYMGTSFRGAPTDSGFEGGLSVLADGGLSVEAPARLRPVKCRN